MNGIETASSESTELVLLEKGHELEGQSREIVVTNDEEFASAGEFAREVKLQQKTVQEYFKPLKDAAHKTHQMLCARENEFLKPLKSAEDACKTAMISYNRKKQEEARKRQEEMQRLAREEADRKLAEAEVAQKKGDEQAMESAIQQAIVADQIGATQFVPCSAPKVSGISQKADWEIVSIDDKEVPIDLNGCMLRPVDAKAVLSLIRATKGQIKIPGVVYRETVKMSVTSRRA